MSTRKSGCRSTSPSRFRRGSLLVKGYHADILFTYSDYKKFQTDSRMVSTGEPQF